ncbi:MAG: NPCBM/NEW2 domain-containing protein, partial [Armatimonadota bacterium]|nr:NPCBM/NEW2 domain-containing protein [Armatimonadota bacterium]
MTSQALPAQTIQATSGEMQTKRIWLDRHLLKLRLAPGATAPAPQAPGPPQPGLDVYANNDPVVPHPLGSKTIRIGDREFTRGLYVHAVSNVVVHLPRPGKSFTASVGLDHNDDTARGKGSVVFSVKVKDQTLFQSDVMRFETPARDVNVDLGGADTFTLEVGDAGDGIGWDQSDWADAKATLSDGTELWLGDMPIRDHRITASLPSARRTSDLPFSFVYGGRPSDELLASWPKTTTSRKLDAARREHTYTWTDPLTGLQVRCTAVDYNDFPAAEWTVYFLNTGKANTPLLESIQGLDTQFQRSASGEYVLHGSKGDWDAPEGYQPVVNTLAPDTTKRFAPDGGRPTNGPTGWPYFNLAVPGGGTIFAVGWPGQWACSFVRDTGTGLRVAAGQELTHLYLKPGEEVRSPLTAMLFWEGADTVRAQNLWRRWFMAHNIPRINGQPQTTMAQMQCYKNFENGPEKDMFDTVNAFNKANIHFDICWRDAGWYPCGGHWPNTGTWEPDPARYPRGFKPFSDWIHTQGKKFIVWFEPERVGDPNSWLGKNHPEWLLGGTLLNLGNPEARTWLTNHVDTLMREQGIDYYRQDFNMDPLSYWRQNDAPDRQGITENLHVQGYLAYWDE